MLPPNSVQRRSLDNHGVPFRGGDSIQWNYVYEFAGNAEMSEMFDQRSYNQTSASATASVDMKFIANAVAFEERILKMQSNTAQIVDYMSTEVQRGVGAYVELLEHQIWGKPTADGQNVINGITWWVTANATEGFNGGAPSGFSTRGGISTAYTRGNNYTNTFTAVSEGDFVTKMSKAIRKTGWKSPAPMPGQGKYVKFDRCIYTGDTNYGQYESFIRGNNESIGVDMGWAGQNDKIHPSMVSLGKMISIYGVPFVYAPVLDGSHLGLSATRDVFCLDHTCLFPVIMERDYKTPFVRSDNNARVIKREDHTSFNLKCTDLSRQSRLYWVA